MSIFSWNKNENNEKNLIRFLEYLIQTIENHNPDMDRVLNELKSNYHRALDHRS